jgi:hypothetical protein
VSPILILLLTVATPAASPALANLDFSTGTFKGWEGEGFYMTSASSKAPGLGNAACSSDQGTQGRTATLHRTIVVPPNAGAIRFQAFARLGKDCEDLGRLDVVLFAAGRQVLAKKVHGPSDWQPAGRVLPPLNGKPREYVWPVSNYVGQTLRIALVDDDKRPGCYLYCSGFSIIPSDEFEAREFGRFMVKLTNDHKLPPAARFDSKHFLAMSNADDEFAAMRLHNCELIYELFFDHFRRKGFRLHEPPGKLMLAIFDSQAGFEAYLAHKMPPSVTGVYHLESNRLLVYDYGTNESFVDFKRNVKQVGRQINSELDRQRFVETENRRAREFRTGINIGTVMHEVAHQLSFNTGMLNRDGDVPIWVAEGLACYCESTDNSAWQGIGEPNPERLIPLAAVVNAKGKFIPLRDMICGDGWLREQKEVGVVLLAYAQSWALFRMLMEERPEQMRRFLSLTYSRRTPDHRLADFGQAFGSDLDRLELRYGEYMKELVERYYKPNKR